MGAYLAPSPFNNLIALMCLNIESKHFYLNLQLLISTCKACFIGYTILFLKLKNSIDVIFCYYVNNLLQPYKYETV